MYEYIQYIVCVQYECMNVHIYECIYMYVLHKYDLRMYIYVCIILI